jgi:hypothetical protein
MKKFVILALLAVLAAGCAHHRRESAPPAPVVRNDYPYHSPLSTPGSRFGALPVVVQNSVRSEAGTAEIVDVRKETRAGKVFYKIFFRDERNYPPLFIGPNGDVLNPDLSVAVPAPQEILTDVKLNDLPVGVLKAIQQHALPGSEVASVSKESWGDHTVYVVNFKDDVHHPKMYVIADGTELIKAPQ